MSSAGLLRSGGGLRVCALGAVSVALLAAAAPVQVTTPVAPATGDGVFDHALERVVEGVYVAVRPDVFRQPVDANIVFIVNDADIVVVDSGGGEAAAESALQLLRQLTDKPVRYLVNTHWHGDHHLGNAVFLREFPGLELVGHPRTAAAMTPENIGIERFQPQLVETIAALRRGIASGKDDDGQQLLPDRLSRWRQMVPDLEAGLTEYRRARIEPPTLTIEDALVLRRGEREIQIRHLGRGNTDGDLVAWLPKERVLISGDLVVHPLPYGFGSFPAEWPETLERMVALDYDYLVPGHGAVQRDASYVRQLQALIGEIRADVSAAAAEGASLEEARQRIDLGPLAETFSGGDARRRMLLDAWFVQPFSLSVYKEAKGEPIVQGQQG